MPVYAFDDLLKFVFFVGIAFLLQSQLSGNDFSTTWLGREAVKWKEFTNSNIQSWLGHEPSPYKYTNGTVFIHNVRKYRGVVYMTDPKCVQDEDWIKMFKVDQLSRGRNQPFYSSLIHTKDLPKDHRAYVAEEHITPITDQKIIHPDLYKYFHYYDEKKGKYVPREIYYEDEE